MSDAVLTVLIGGVVVVTSLVVAKWVNRHADRQDNGGHHKLVRAEIRLPFPDAR